jgi:predicted HicB family RNase H-like nuclease
MEKHTQNSGSTLICKNTESEDKCEFRDTVMIRISRHLRDAIKYESDRTKESMSRIVDWAAEEYLDSVKPLD